MFKKLRKEKACSQAEMARLCGVSVVTWRRWEMGEFIPTRERLELLARAELPCQEFLLTATEARQWGSRFPFELATTNSLNWKRAFQFWLRPIARLGLNPSLVDWLKLTFPCDSALEAFGWLQLAVAHAEPLLANPHFLGFRHHPIVDAHGKALGERLLAGLRLRWESSRMLVWPQVPMLVDGKSFRCDGLVLLRHNRHSQWRSLEFDGAGHDFSKDDYRRMQLGLREIRISGDEIKRTLALERFLALAKET